MATKENIFKRAFNVLWQNPIIIKELRSRMRRRRSYVILSIYLVLAAGITSVVYFAIASSNEFYPDPDVRRTIGQAIFLTAILIQLAAVNFVSPAFTSGAISGERENQTYALLRTTPVSARDIVRGKLLSGLLFTLLLLIASIPLQGMAFLFGGVELPELLVSNLMLLVTAILFSAIGIYTSSWMKRSIPATILAYVIANSSLILIPLLVWIISVFFPSFIDIIDFSSDDSPFLIIVRLSLLWLLISSNPIFAGIISEVFLLDENVVFFYTTDITKNFTAHLPSPWITFTLLNLFLAWLFYRGAIRRVAQRDKE